MRTFLFPGQGSQARGMGGALFDEFPDLTRQADDILGYSIKKLCLEDPDRQLSRTQFTQPALYVVNALAYFKRIREGDGEPDYLAGHSLGEFNALLAAGCFDFACGLGLVKKRGELLGCPTNGGMVAIMNASKEKVADILREHNATGIDIAIHNSPTQTVIAGLKEDLARMEPYFLAAQALYYPLNTSGAFHSRYMQEAAEQFRAYLASMRLAPVRVPVIANVSARPYRDEDVLDNLVTQITGQVRWAQTIQYLSGMAGMRFEEIGHGDVLTKMLKWFPKQLQPTPSAPARTALDKVNSWNAAHPVGTQVRAQALQGQQARTRTAALVLFGHRAAVYLQGYHGYFDLDQLEPTAT
jgi:malonyl CoA-acyl carrier protein transacylase